MHRCCSLTARDLNSSDAHDRVRARRLSAGTNRPSYSNATTGRCGINDNHRSLYSLEVFLVSHSHQRVVHLQHLFGGQVPDVEFELHDGCVVSIVLIATVFFFCVNGFVQRTVRRQQKRRHESSVDVLT